MADQSGFFRLAALEVVLHTDGSCHIIKGEQRVELTASERDYLRRILEAVNPDG